MEKKILNYSYWLGVVCVVIAVVWRTANFAGHYLGNVLPGVTISYMSFFKAALLFLMIAIASAGMILAKKQ
jgi:DMSO/TMAO reductase YedYZ heme-binding membrane subunit